MKITLIALEAPGKKCLTSFGVRTLAASLKREGHDVQTVFLIEEPYGKYCGKTIDEVARLSSSSGLIGISLMSAFFDNAIQITRKIKESLDTPLIWGGVHPTVAPEVCLDYADMVCIGEGERTLTELAQKMEKGQYFRDTQGLWLKNNGKIVKNRLRLLIQDLDSIPFPDYDYENQYVLSDGCIRRMDEALHRRYMQDHGIVYTTISTRGCPFGCSYCCNNAFNKMYAGQKIVRKRSTDSIIRELTEIKNKFPFITFIILWDDGFFLRTEEEIRIFCEKYKRNIGLSLHVGGANPASVTREKLALLVDAGMITLQCGIETASERTKRMYKRQSSNEQLKKTTGLMNEFKYRLTPTYDIILDNPWETDEDLTCTLMFLANLPLPYSLPLFSLVFYPGTELYKKAIEGGIIKDDLKNHYYKNFHADGSNYFNRLFVLLQEYVAKGKRIPPAMMSLLTNQKLRKSKLSWFLYYALKIRIAGIAGIIRYNYFRRIKQIIKGVYHQTFWDKFA